MGISDWSSDECSSYPHVSHIVGRTRALVGPTPRRQSLHSPSCLSRHAEVHLYRHRTGLSGFASTSWTVSRREEWYRRKPGPIQRRTEAVRVGKGGVSPCSSRWPPSHKKKTHTR